MGESSKWLLDLYLADLQDQLGLKLSKEVLAELKRHPQGIVLRFVADFVLCHLIFGTLVIAFWRGAWDFALELFHEVRNINQMSHNHEMAPNFKQGGKTT